MDQYSKSTTYIQNIETKEDYRSRIMVLSESDRLLLDKWIKRYKELWTEHSKDV